MGQYFTTGELISSKTADERGIDNRCNKEQVNNIVTLIEKVLDPLRIAYGKPIRVNSGFRCEHLNKVVGGSPTSDHMKGCAADIVGTPATRGENKKLFQLVQSLGLDFKQLINENRYAWVHISYEEGNNRKQILEL